MTVTILQGDALTMLATLESESVQVCVTSPPYFALRDYGVAGQIGLEQTPAEFIARLVAVFEEVKRVLRPDGTCWVNLGDSYAGSGKGPTGSNGIGDQEQRQGFSTVSKKTGLIGGAGPKKNGKPQTLLGGGNAVEGIAPKNLLLIPERFAIAMQDAGWIVRSRIAWCKKSGMPESVRDRPTSAWEHIWMFSKSHTYYYDADAVRQTAATGDPCNPSYRANGKSTGRVKHMDGAPGQEPNHGFVTMAQNGERRHESGANMRNFWLLGPEPSREEHYAVFPTEIPKRCILAGTSQKGACPACGAPWRRVVEKEPTGRRPGGNHVAPEVVTHMNGKGSGGHVGGTLAEVSNYATRTTGWAPGCSCDAGPPVPQTVLDPFLGSGTTALVADRLDRHAIGVELNPEYAEMARRRIEQDTGWPADVTTVAAPVHIQLPLLAPERACPERSRGDDQDRRAVS